MGELSGMLFPVGTILLIVFLQVSFWFPIETKRPQSSDVPTQTKSIASNSKTGDRRNADNGASKRPTVDVVSKRMTVNAQVSSAENDFRCVIAAPTKIKNETAASGQFNKNNNKNSEDSAPPTIQDGRIWKCACELGILPAGILKTFGNAEAMMRLGVGQCYHKK